MAGLGWRIARLANRQRPSIFYVVDGANWSFDWDGRYITEGLRKRCGLDARTVVNLSRLRGEIVHFGSRYAFFQNANRLVHLTNRVFLTWFHGDLSDPAMKPFFDSLAATAWEVEKIVVPCNLSRQPLLEIGIPAKRLATIPLGVETNLFKPANEAARRAIRRDLSIPDGSFVIGSFQKDGVGWEDGVEPKLVKGPDVFLDAVSRLRLRMSDLFILLTGPARGYVRNGLERMGVPYRHHLLEDYRAIVPFYQCLDAYLIASRCDGGPKALLESWACGIPLVTTRVGMAADLVVDGVNGAMVDQEDVVELVERMLAIHDDPDYARRIARAGSRSVAALDWFDIAGRYASELYAPWVGRRPDPGAGDRGG